jgi:hypothetical protein
VFFLAHFLCAPHGFDACPLSFANVATGHNVNFACGALPGRELFDRFLNSAFGTCFCGHGFTITVGNKKPRRRNDRVMFITIFSVKVEKSAIFGYGISNIDIGGCHGY